MKKILFSAAALPNRAIDAAWLLFRLHVGLSIADGAGLPKITNLAAVASAQVPGPPDWFVQQVAGLGFTFPSPYFWAGLAVYGEFFGGLLIALGLFTRWSGLQLAFQFFVVAFIWYQDPSPITGMYFQQLLFWAFVVITAVGPGRYSLDYLITRRSAAEPAAELVPNMAGVSTLKRPVAAGVAVLAGLLLATVAWAGPVFSDLFIQPGEQFVLGGGQKGEFKVQAHNKGRVAVKITERFKFGGTEEKGMLKPGGRATLSFGNGSSAIILNSSDQKANLGLKITGTTDLGMRTQAAESQTKEE